MNGVEETANLPIASSSGSNENFASQNSSFAHGPPQIEPQTQESHELSSVFGASHENAGGMTRIIPSNIDVSVVFPIVFDWLLVT